MLVEDMADYLTTGGGWTQGSTGGVGDLYITAMPDADRVPECVTLYDAPGFGPINAMGVRNLAKEQAGLQIVGRGRTYKIAHQMVYKAYLRINGMDARVLNGCQYDWAAARSVPFPMGREDQTKLFLCAVNFDILKDKSTTS